MLLILSISVTAFLFVVFYSRKGSRCNSEFAGQLHCLSGIMVCNKPLFGVCMHCVGGMLLLSVGLRVDTDKEVSLLMLAFMFASLSGVVNFDVRDHKPVHFCFLAGVLAFSMAFVWLQCSDVCRLVYSLISVAFVLLIVFNFSCTNWTWHWMDIQAITEIVWVVSLLVCMISFAHAFDPS